MMGPGLRCMMSIRRAAALQSSKEFETQTQQGISRQAVTAAGTRAGPRWLADVFRESLTAEQHCGSMHIVQPPCAPHCEPGLAYDGRAVAVGVGMRTKDLETLALRVALAV